MCRDFKMYHDRRFVASALERPAFFRTHLVSVGAALPRSSNTSNMCSKCWASKSILAADSQGQKDSSNGEKRW